MRTTLSTLALLGTFVAAASAAGDNWPQFRGPHGDGHSAAKGLPVKFSDTEKVKWKTPIHDRGWSSPVIWGDQIWLTTATEFGDELFALCLDRKTGRIVHDVKAFTASQTNLWQKYNSYASPTPVIEEGRVYVTFGEAGTACLDTKTAKVLWERRDLRCNHFRGAGSSPILHGNLLILNFDGSDAQFIVALNKQTGKTVWNVKRSVDYRDLDASGKPKLDGDLRKAYGTCHLAKIDGKDVLLSSGAMAHYAYEPLTGKELWRVETLENHSTGNRPFLGHGLIFISAGFSKGQLLAIKPPPAKAWNGSVLNATRDSEPEADKPQLAWRVTKSVPASHTPVLVGDLIFMVDNSGLGSCLDARTGKEIWAERVFPAPAFVYASPMYAEGRIYAAEKATREPGDTKALGRVAVFKAGREYELLAMNLLDSQINASPVALGKSLFIRTAKSLYCFEE
jgi:outer membrane protein assembly factor BamB